MSRWFQILTCPAVALLAVCVAAVAWAASDSELPRQARRPVALVVQGECVLVGNLRGSISVLEASSGRVLAEHKVARRIADLAVLPGGQSVLVLDEQQRRLLKVTLAGGRATTRAIAEVPLGAARLAVATEGRQVFVSGLWSHVVQVLSFDDDFEQATDSHSIELPFAPRELLLVDHGRTLLVADAFGGRLAVIDVPRRQIVATRRIKGHNLRGLAVSRDGTQLYVAHQVMAAYSRADYEEVHWGRLLTNAVEEFDLPQVLRADAAEALAGWCDSQEDVGRGAADPAAVVAGDDLVAVALAGVGEVYVRRRGYARRISVQSGPQALAVQGDRLFVANRLSDSVSIIDLEHGKLVQTVSLGPPPELSAAERGERLFYDARLSHDGWMSCHSCHTDGHTAGLNVDTLGDGDYGAPKRIPSLLGTRDTGPWSWNGSSATLDQQVRKSTETTMHGQALTDRQAADLVAFLESLDAPPSRFLPQQAEIDRGRKVFRSRGCVECHAGEAFTQTGTFDVGLADERGRREFNPPSLRGLAQRDRFFHDGRATRLEDVLQDARHQLDRPLSDAELTALLAYLRSL